MVFSMAGVGVVLLAGCFAVNIGVMLAYLPTVLPAEPDT
mgnify:CR=1 FL=1